uniref:Uncharacterized protein n=1 Tax=Romanomermis culicivorax TaxID=13658 RepID=A0A915K1B0_ROMCU
MIKAVAETAIKAEDAVENAVKSASKNGEIYKVLPLLVLIPGGNFIYDTAEQLARNSQKEAKNKLPAVPTSLYAVGPVGSIAYGLWKVEAEKVANEIASAEEKMIEAVAETAIKAEDAVENAVKSAIKNGEIYNALPSLLVPGGSLIFMAKEALAEE